MSQLVKRPVSKTTYSIEAVSRAIDILAAFSMARPTLTLAQVVACTSLPKTTAFRILATLVDGGLCEYNTETMSYSLGFKMLQMGEVRRKQSNLWSLSAPVMRQIRDEIGETVVLSIRRGDLRIQIDAAEGLHSLRRIADPGLHAPLYAGAASRVLLAGMSEPDINAYLRRTPLKQIQKNTMTSVDLLLAELAVILAQGYAESSNEVLEGGAALAAPIRNMSGATVGVLDIITPESRYSPEHREKALRLLLEGVASISRRAGAGS